MVTREPSVTPRNEAVDLLERLTRLSDTPRSGWHDTVLPNGAGDSWACVSISDVIEIAGEAVDAALRTERLRLNPVWLAAALDNVDREYEQGWTPAHYARAIADEYRQLAILDEAGVAGLTGMEPSVSPIYHTVTDDSGVCTWPCPACQAGTPLLPDNTKEPSE